MKDKKRNDTILYQYACYKHHVVVRADYILMLSGQKYLGIIFSNKA